MDEELEKKGKGVYRKDGIKRVRGRRVVGEKGKMVVKRGEWREGGCANPVVVEGRGEVDGAGAGKDGFKEKNRKITGIKVHCN